MDDKQLYSEFEELIRSMPPIDQLWQAKPEDLIWLAKAKSLMKLWDVLKAVEFDSKIDRFYSSPPISQSQHKNGIFMLLHEARHDLQLKTLGSQNVALNEGNVFDYFNEIRKVVQSAKIDLFFVDPYIDSDFVERYLPHVTAGAKVRLLCKNKINALIPSIQLFSQQNQLSIEVRSDQNIHDRYVFVDKIEGYHSSASFKDGAKNAPAQLMTITDIFTNILSIYEQKWKTGTVHI